MNWYKTAQEEVSPEEVGYDPEWGEHHGPVTMKRDTWNYGPRGYPSDQGPMPLPKKLYHVTPFADKIVEEGFKMFDDMSKQTFGGHGKYVSFTSLANAETYQDALRDFILMARIPAESKDYEDMLQKVKPFMEKWSVRSAWLGSVQRTYDDWREGDKRERMEKALLSELGTMHIFSGKDFPLFLSSYQTAKRLSSLDPRNVRIIEVETQPSEWHSGVNIFDQSMKGRYTYNAHEKEWRIWDPDQVTTIRVL